jgi:protein TonB
MTPFSPFSSTPTLWTALAVSIVLHAFVLFAGPRLVSSFKPSERVADSLRVKLVDPVPPLAPAAPLSQPELLRREDTPRKTVTPALQKQKPASTASVPPRLVRPPDSRRSDSVVSSRESSRELRGDAARKATEQIARQLFYPPEAIARGLEGETLVLLFLDEAGNAIAARIEASSGHALLDEAAVRAARTLRSLPAAAPREAIVPVRFRLR